MKHYAGTNSHSEFGSEIASFVFATFLFKMTKLNKAIETANSSQQYIFTTVDIICNIMTANTCML